MKINYHYLGFGLLALFFIFLLITLVYINPIEENKHPIYNQTKIDAKYGFYMTNITCPNCHSSHLEPYSSHIVEDNHNKKITTFFYCKNCSTLFSIRPSM